MENISILHTSYYIAFMYYSAPPQSNTRVSSPLLRMSVETAVTLIFTSPVPSNAAAVAVTPPVIPIFLGVSNALAVSALPAISPSTAPTNLVACKEPASSPMYTPVSKITVPVLSVSEVVPVR